MPDPETSTRKLLVFGGSFDPPHNGHLVIARDVAEACGFRRVLLMPAGSPPHKPGPTADGRHRVEMLRAAVAGEERFEVSDLEIARDGPSYTFDTIMAVRKREGPGASVYWLIGADMLASLATWHRAAEVVDAANLLTAHRPGWEDRMEQIFADLGGSFSPPQVSKLRQGLVRTRRMELSSTEIRDRLAEGRSVRHMIPDAVGEYIRREGLYRPAGRENGANRGKNREN